MARTRLPVDERRTQLLEAALRLFLTRRWDDVAMDEIATEARVSKGLLYHYFPSKRDLYVAVVSAVDEQFRSRTQPDESLPAPERLATSLAGFLDFAERHGDRYLTLLRGGIGSDDEVWRIVEDSRNLAVQRVLDGLDHEPSPAVRLAVRGWIGFVEAAVAEWLVTRAVGRDDLLRTLTASLTAILTAAGVPVRRARAH